MKGIILAAGNSTRLHPATIAITKQLLPIYDKPMIYYPLSSLIIANIRDILLICSPKDIFLYKLLLGDGSHWGINITYAEQPEAKGIADAYIIGADFVGNDNSALILGDNIFYGSGFINELESAAANTNGATVFAYWVHDPERYGVVTIDEEKRATDLVEKPKNPKSNWAVTGLYFYDNQVKDIAKCIKPSNRGELEITDINRIYLENKKLNVKLLGRGYTWMDAGTPRSLLEASEYISIIEHRQGLKIGCIEEIVWKKSWIDDEQLLRLASKFKEGCLYRTYLENILKYR